MTRLHMVLLILMCIGANVLQSGAETLLATEGDLVTLPCSLSGTFIYPVWFGPPSLEIYTNQDSPTINSAVNASDRLSYASNQKDLLLANAVVADSGEYKCSYAGLGEYTFNLNVSEKTSTATTTSAPTTVSESTTVSDCGLIVFRNCNLSKGVGVFLWCFTSICLVALVTVVVILILRFVIGVKFPCRILNCENKRTSPKGSKSEKKSTEGKHQGTQDEENKILALQDTNYTKKRPPAKLDQLDEPGSKKHHIGGRPLPEIGKYKG